MATELTAVNLQAISTYVSGFMNESESKLKTTLAGMGDGSKASVTDMVGLQYAMSVYTLSGQTISAIMKECSDTMKSVVQKI